MAKDSSLNGKVGKPHPGFPLTPHHGSGKWCRKVGGKVYYFGRINDPEGALAEWNAAKDNIFAGRGRDADPDAVTVRDMLNAFLTAKEIAVRTGELTLRSYNDYRRVCDLLAAELGRATPLTALRPADFARIKAKLASKSNPTTLGNEIQRIRVVLNYAVKADLVDRPIRIGPDFKRPARRVLRRVRNAAGAKTLEADEIRAIVAACKTPAMRAMVLLGINAGLGNTDVSGLRTRHVDLSRGWMDYPRPKTEVPRRAKLWKETIQAIQAALAVRPAPRLPTDADLVFVTRFGNQYVTFEAKGGGDPFGKDAGYVVSDAVAQEFGKARKAAGITRAVGFYTLRRMFETIAGETTDQPAVDMVMGHDDGSMASVYRQRIGDDRLERVAEHVREWLFGGVK